MRNLLFATTLLLALAVAADDDDGPKVATITSPASTPIPLVPGTLNGCTPTAPPLVVTPSEIFAPYWCIDANRWPHGPARCTMWHYDSTVSAWVLKYAGVSGSQADCFPQTPMLVTQSIRNTVVATHTTTYALGTDTTWVMAFNSSRSQAPGEMWKINTLGNNAGIATDPETNSVFFGKGNHPDPVKPTDTVTSMECVNGLTGKDIWVNGTRYFADSVLSQPLYYEQRLYFMFGAWLHMLPSNTGEWNMDSGTKVNPCGFEDDGKEGRNIKMKLVDFGWEGQAGGGHKKLSAIILYGNTKNEKYPTAPRHFNLCRIHHKNMFGEVEQFSYQTPDRNLTVAGISGGDNATFVTFMEDGKFIIFNSSNVGWNAHHDRLVLNVSRSLYDRFNQPHVLYYNQPWEVQTKAPMVVHGWGSQVHYWDTWRQGVVHKLQIQCRTVSKPALTKSVLFCAGGGSTALVLGSKAAAIDYTGDILWTGENLVTATDPITVGDEEVFYTGVSIVGVGFRGHKPKDDDDDDDKGASAGVVVLVIILVIFSLVVIAGLAKYVFLKNGSYSPLRPGVNATASAEEGSGVKTTLSNRSMQDVDDDSAASGGRGGGYGALNE